MPHINLPSDVERADQRRSSEGTVESLKRAIRLQLDLARGEIDYARYVGCPERAAELRIDANGRLADAESLQNVLDNLTQTK